MRKYELFYGFLLGFLTLFHGAFSVPFIVETGELILKGNGWILLIFPATYIVALWLKLSGKITKVYHLGHIFSSIVAIMSIFPIIIALFHFVMMIVFGRYTLEQASYYRATYEDSDVKKYRKENRERFGSITFKDPEEEINQEIEAQEKLKNYLKNDYEKHQEEYQQSTNLNVESSYHVHISPEAYSTKQDDINYIKYRYAMLGEDAFKNMDIEEMTYYTNLLEEIQTEYNNDDFHYIPKLEDTKDISLDELLGENYDD